ncbi:ABC transporter substrate-binding protein [Acinetobacter sp. A3.8]|uniref:ABC transporter substrate-binding protein n=1 Tax=Acinetobacter sedimenti TaxID=2919922 RepID=A0A9X2B5R1_9GAMM|nr:ABC transporter substrate-binding protein [Acinetobacter sedimenti]MCJ8146016.1 ABC transporter substrate-binding protein [Acinetobacter sedimenti]
MSVTQFESEQNTADMLKIGYLPLVDSIALLWAQHRGYFSAENLTVELVRETSWATLRDRLAFGMLQAAHCLSPIVASACSTADDIGIPMRTALVLSHNTAKISLKRELYDELAIQANDLPHQSAAKFVAKSNEMTHKLAQVFPASLHHFTLREWLRLADQDFAHQCKLATLPPHYMLDAIDQGMIDGCCVGEPWNSVGATKQISKVVCRSQDVIPSIADKVLAVTSEWATQHSEAHQAMIRALIKAQQDLSKKENSAVAYQLLQQFDIIDTAFDSSLDPAFGSATLQQDVELLILQIHQQNMQPKATDFDWILSQLKAWLHADLDAGKFQDYSLQCIDLACYQEVLSSLN